MSRWKLYRLPAHCGCAAVESGEVNAIGAANHLAPILRVDDFVQFEVFYAAVMERRCHAHLRGRQPGLPKQIIEPVIIPTITLIRNPNIIHLPVEYRIGIENARSHFQRPIVAVVLVLIFVAMDRAPAIQGFIGADSNKARGLDCAGDQHGGPPMRPGGGAGESRKPQ